MLDINTTDKANIKRFLEHCEGCEFIGFEEAGENDWLRFWKENKQNLFTLLGNSLVHSFDVHVSQEEMIENVKLVDDEIEYFYSCFLNGTFKKWLIKEKIFSASAAEFLLERYLKIGDLKDNSFMICGEFQTERPRVNGSKPMVIKGRQNPSKLFMRLAKAFNAPPKIINGLEEMRVAISKASNIQAKDYKLCISIHPLDFLTCSTTNTWSSCMDYNDNGEYRAGVIELINSPFVVEAYLPSTKSKVVVMDNHYDNVVLRWNNKRWRQFFIVHPDFIVSSRSYPNSMLPFTNAVMDELRRLAEENWGIEYEKSSHFKDMDDNSFWNVVDRQAEKGKLFLSTNFYYNDLYYFPAEPENRVAYRKGFDIDKKSGGHGTFLNFSGELVSIATGKILLNPANEVSIEDYCYDCYENDRGSGYWSDYDEWDEEIEDFVEKEPEEGELFEAYGEDWIIDRFGSFSPIC